MAINEKRKEKKKAQRMSIETWLTSFLDVVTEPIDSQRWGLGFFFLLDDLHRETEREVGTLFWKPWSGQVR